MGCRTILLDLDGTLYSVKDYPEFALHMDEVTGRRLRGALDAPCDREAFELLVEAQERHGFASKSEALPALFGFDLASMNRWREEHTEPERFLRRDADLAEALARLASQFTLVLGTNSTRLLTERILATLGIPVSLLHAVVDSEMAGFAKPDRRFFEFLLARVGGRSEEGVRGGGRLASDIEPAHELGMRAFHVSGPEQIVRLAAAVV